MTDLQKEQTISLHNQGIGYAKIGQALGVSVNTIRSFCQRHKMNEKEQNTLFCMQCGKPMKVIPKRKPKKFCRDRCRNLWWNSHPEYVKRKSVYAYTCIHCGKSCTAYGNKNRKYCSHQCYISDRFGRERDACE